MGRIIKARSRFIRFVSMTAVSGVMGPKAGITWLGDTRGIQVVTVLSGLAFRSACLVAMRQRVGQRVGLVNRLIR